MRKNNNILFLLAGICAVLAIPIAMVIISNMQASMIMKTIVIMIAYLVLLIAVLLLYKKIYGVTVQELAQGEPVTELDRLGFRLAKFKKLHTDLQYRRCIDIVGEQIRTFHRRKEVLLQITGNEPGMGERSAIGSLIQSVEEMLTQNIERLMNRVEIFDDRGSREMIRQNIEYMEKLLFDNNEILTEFEKLITEASQLGEEQDTSELDKLRDVITAMQNLRKDQDDEIDELSKKYK